MSGAAQATRRAILAGLAAAAAAPALAQPYPRPGGDYLPVDGGRLYFETAGTGSRTLILMHDTITDLSVWDDVWPIFAREFRVVRYDQRGFGRTPPSTTRYLPVADLQALIAHLAVPSAVLIAGSASAQTAIECAVMSPAQVQQLLLVSPLLGPAAQPLQERIQANNAPLASDDVAGAINNWVNDPNMVAGPNRRARARLRAILEASPQDLTNRDTMVPPRVAIVSTLLNRIQAQTMILTGARDLPGVVSQGESLARMIPGAQRAPVQGSGHLIYLDEPDIFAAAANAFVRAWQSRDP